MRVHPTERDEHLWIPVIAPGMWAAHFMASYLTVALWCGRSSAGTVPGDVRGVIGAYTVVALLGMAASFARALRRHRRGRPGGTDDSDTPEDRRRFVAATTMLLAGMSMIATIYAWLAIAVVHRCPS
jgi:hypothetical protein